MRTKGKALIFVTSLFIIYITVFDDRLRNLFRDDISCYEKTNGNHGILELDLSADGRPELGRSIFFFETSCFKGDEIHLNARQACAVESAARMNPKMTVYLLFLTSSRIAKSSRRIIQELMSYNNIKIRRIFMNKYVENTPLSKWYSSSILETSNWPRSHISDILRYLTLWKFGGIYMDLDVVVMKTLDGLGNFAGAEDWEDVAAGFIGLGMDSLGRKLADDVLKDLKMNFDGQKWGNNGPGVITRVLQKLCDTKYARDMTSSRCQGFKVYSPYVFYPIGYESWRRYFESENRDETMKLIENAKAIHVWNNFSKDKKILVGDEVPYTTVAKKYCPVVYNNCVSFF